LRRTSRLLFAFVFVATVGVAEARPPGPATVCATYPDSAFCSAGKLPDCAVCHQGPPVRNAFGAAVDAALPQGQLTDSSFADALPAALEAIADADTDGDGASNLDELLEGTFPADPSSNPGNIACPENDYYNLCDYDHAFAYKRVSLDFCGRSPTFEEMEAFRAMDAAAKEAEIDARLTSCFDSDFWQGTDGVLWSLANRKIRPVGSLKAGPQPGTVPVADYDHDYNLFVWSQIDDHDAREAMTAEYFVVRDSDGALRPITEAEEPTLFVNGDRENVDPPFRAGLLTTRWNLLYFEMFAILPRAAAAQARRAWLRQDWARMEGLNPVAGQPFDYDNAGVSEPLCAVCHSTIDAEAQAWRNYTGFVGPGSNRATYFDGNDDFDQRMEAFEGLYPGIGQMGDGYFNGQVVGEVVDWALAASNSDQFARATVMDYFEIFADGEPSGFEIDEYDALWQGFRTDDAYSVEQMLRRLVRTRSYGEP
jgi:hypothetical protein